MRVIKKSFGIILTLSLISLALLITGVFLLTKNNNKTFISDGYIITYKSGNTNVYNFDKGETYKYNVNGDLVFKNEKSKKVTAELENFIHYTNGNIAFLKNGVILDLDKISETVIPYYNITNKSLLEFNNDEFKIANINGDLNIKRFIGRIADNKFIVSAKNITARLSGNSEVITSSNLGNFFEITYAENGVVIISDGKNTHTTTADKSYIYIGEDIVINLGDKNIFSNDQQKLSLNQLTIDGNENIEIMPPEETESEKNAKEQDAERQRLEAEQQRLEAQIAEIERQQRELALVEENDDIINENNKLAEQKRQLQAKLNEVKNSLKEIKTKNKELENDKAKLEEDNKNLDNQNKELIEEKEKQEQKEHAVSVTKNPIFRVVKADVGANKLDLDIDITDEYKVIDGNLDFVIINMKTGETVYRDTISDISQLVEISTPAGTLSPKTNYIVSISGNYKNEDISYNKQFFQRVFVTEELGITLTKDYVTNTTLAMNIDVNNTLAVKGFDLTVYDKDNNEISKKNITIDNETTNVEFDELNPNTEYTVVLNNITYNNVIYSDTDSDNEYATGDYTLTEKVKTLKRKPIVRELKATVNKEKTKVTFNITDIEDVDKAVTGYRYYVYTYDNVTGDGGQNPVTTIEKKDATPFDIEIDGTTLKSGQSYRYMVVVEYNDNEKDVEYNTGFSNSFVAGAVPSTSFELDNDTTTFNTISGTIKISDDNCTVPLSGRSCDGRANNIFVRYYESGSTTISYSSIEASFDPVNLTYRFDTSGLKENTNYTIEVFGGIDFKDGNGIQECNKTLYDNGECVQIGESMYAKTKSVVPVTVDWGNERISKQEQVFSLGGNKLKSTSNSNAEAKEMMNLSFKVYASPTKKMEDATLIKTVEKTNNIKHDLFDNNFTISATETFDLNIDKLKTYTNGILSKYYIFELNDASDSAAINTIPIENNTYVFETNPDLRADDILKEPTITTKIIKSNNTDSRVNVTAEYDASNLELLYPNADFNLILGACSITTGECYDLPSVRLEELTSVYTKNFTLKEGTDYYTVDPIKDNNKNLTLYRGNKYKFRFYITVDDEKNGTIDYYYPGRIKADYIESANFSTAKNSETSYKMNIVSSTNDSITYNFSIINPDLVLYKDKTDEKYSIYYKIGDTEYKVPINTYGQNTNFTITGLANNQHYSVYYKTAKTKTGSAEEDIQIISESKYTFDGYHDLSQANLQYKIENKPAANKVTIKIIDTQELRNNIDRISTFHVAIIDKNDNKVIDNKYYSTLEDCSEEECYKYIDYNYTNLEKYNKNNYTSLNKNLEVKLYAYYDTGLIANDFSVGYDQIEQKNTSEYGYLLQQYSNETSQSNYLVLDSTMHVIESPKPLDLYYYTLNGSRMILYNLIKNNTYYSFEDAIKPSSRLIYNERDINLVRTSEGYKYGTYTVNTKTTNKKEFQHQDSNIFVYTTIIPNISSTYDGIINGADIKIDSRNITEEVLNKYFIKEDDKYYYYIDLLDAEENIIEGKRKVEINPGTNTTFTYENLDDNTTYKYRIYAKLSNGQSHTELNDINKNEPTIYTFNTLKGEDLFGNIDSTYKSTSNEQKYANRTLNLDITLNNEIKNVLKNYDLIVNLIENDTVVDTTTINNEELANNKKIDFDITNYDAIYGNEYFKIQLLAKTTTTTGEKNVTIYDEFITLDELKIPNINVTKSAYTDIEESNYIYTLDYKIAINDIDKVIKDGKYSLVLLNNAGDIVKTVEDIPIVTEDGIYLKEVKFSNVSEDPKYQVDLKPNREYTLRVIYDTYRNNQSLRQEAINISADISSYTNRHNEYNYTIYTSGIYGVSLGEIDVKGFSNYIEMKFYSSANLDKLTKIYYQLTKEGQATPISSHEYTLGAGKDKTFSVIEGTNGDKYYKLTLDKEDIRLDNSRHLLTFQFYITDENGEEQPISTSNNSKYVTIG